MRRFLTFVLCLFSLVLVGCGPSVAPDEPVLIEVDSEFGSSEYYVGEAVDLSKYSLTVHYRSTLVRVVSLSEATVIGLDTSSAGEKRVKISYGGVSVEVTIVVIEVHIISATYVGETINLFVGEEPDLNSIIIRALYSDGSEKEFKLSELTHSALDNTTPGEAEVEADCFGISVKIKFNLSYRPIEIDEVYSVSGEDAKAKIFYDEQGSLKITFIKTSSSSGETTNPFSAVITMAEDNTFSFTYFGDGLKTIKGFLFNGELRFSVVE